jgi:monovalent cation:H+ antiporter-2, CPA2 family
LYSPGSRLGRQTLAHSSERVLVNMRDPPEQAVETIPHLDELAVVAAVSVLVSLVVTRLRLPTVAGLLAAGAMVGPSGLGWVRSSEVIHTLSELGVVFLLFSIGLEFSLSRLRSILRHVALGGGAQVALTIAATGLVAFALGKSPRASLLYGFIFSLSSTAIVLRALTERREIDAPHGKLIVGTLVFQDLCIVPMVLLVPTLGQGDPQAAMSAIVWALVRATGVVVFVVVASRLLVPRFMAAVDASKSREIFLMAVLTICIGTAYLTAQAGLSLALGAFLGGIVVADTEFGHRAFGDVLPLRDAFVSVFFVSMGMLFDASVLARSPLAGGVLLLGFLVGKGLIAAASAMLMRFPVRAASLAGVSLAQFGEFGFVLASLGQTAGILSEDETSLLLSSGLVSMFVTPLLARIAPQLKAGQRLLAPLERLLDTDAIDDVAPVDEPRSGHVVVVGYGVAGKLVASALEASGVDWLAMELNSDTVRRERAQGRPVYYGDATNSEALEHARIAQARALVVVTNDRAAVLRIVDTARRLSPTLFVIVRAHYLGEAAELEHIGVSEVVAEEIESGLEIVARVLRNASVPRNVIETRVEEARERFGQPTAVSRPRTRGGNLGEEALSDLELDSFLVRTGCPAMGKTLVQLDLRQRAGILAVAIRAGEELLHPPPIDRPLGEGDVVYAVGARPAIAGAIALFDAR